jgi:tetratricopeptide (TPR) repeat protein
MPYVTPVDRRPTHQEFSGWGASYFGYRNPTSGGSIRVGAACGYKRPKPSPPHLFVGGYCAPYRNSGWGCGYYDTCYPWYPFGFWYPSTTYVTERIVTEVPYYVEVPAEEPLPAALVKTSEYEEPAADAEEPPAEAPPAEEPDSLEAPPAPAPPGDEAAEAPPLDEKSEALLRDGSAAFLAADYESALGFFKEAVLANPEVAAPRFAYGQTLMAIGEYEDAARVLRRALEMSPGILDARGSIVAVYKEPEEFDRLLSKLRSAALIRGEDADYRFLVLYQLYFSRDPRAVIEYGRLAESHPDDPAVPLFRPALEERFPDMKQFLPK